MKKIARSVNCQACGNEVLSYQARDSKVGSLLMRLCPGCIAKSDAYENYKEAVKILVQLQREGQLNDPELNNPNVIIQPAESRIQKAVDILKRMDPNFFKGVRRIEVSTGPSYGHVKSSPTDDPNVIHINLGRIVNESGNDNTALIRGIASTLAHEKAHLEKFDPKTGFAPEGVAQAEEKRVLNWIDQNADRLKDLFK